MILRVIVSEGTRTVVVYDRDGQQGGPIRITHEVMRLDPGWYDAGSLKPVSGKEIPWIDDHGRVDMRGREGV